MLAGVCGGIAEYIGADPTIIRLGFAGDLRENGRGKGKKALLTA